MDIQSVESLLSKRCVPCEGGVEPCPVDFIQQQLAKLDGWALTANGQRMEKHWSFKNFVQAMSFLNRVAETAESEQHHPDLHLEQYRKVRIEIWTHAIGGLSENDFILAAKIDQQS